MHKHCLFLNFLIREARNLKKTAKLPANLADSQNIKKIQPNCRPLKNFEK